MSSTDDSCWEHRGDPCSVLYGRMGEKRGRERHKDEEHGQKPRVCKTVMTPHWFTESLTQDRWLELYPHLYKTRWHENFPPLDGRTSPNDVSHHPHDSVHQQHHPYHHSHLGKGAPTGESPPSGCLWIFSWLMINAGWEGTVHCGQSHPCTGGPGC